MTRPLLVLVHGTRFDAGSWRDYPHLVPDADVVAIDLPGHGRRGGEPYTTHAALDILGETIASAAAPGPGDSAARIGDGAAAGGAGRPVVLAGHSLGGYVCAAYAQAHPHDLAGLVLIGATADPRRHRVLTGVYTGFARLLPVVGAERMAVGANAVMRRLGADPARLPDARGYAVLPQAWAAVIAESGPEQLADVTCPVRLIAGRYDQLGIDLRAYARACRDAQVHVIAGATHFAPITHPEQVAAVLREAVADAARRDR